MLAGVVMIKVAFLVWGLVCAGFFIGWCACSLLVRRPPPPRLTDDETDAAIERMINQHYGNVVVDLVPVEVVQNTTHPITDGRSNLCRSGQGGVGRYLRRLHHGASRP